MMLPRYMLGLFSLLLEKLGYGSCIWAIFNRNIKSHAFSWIVWGLATSLVFFAQTVKDEGPGAWATSASALASFAIALLALWRGEKKITFGDGATFLGAVLGVPLWYVTKSPPLVCCLAYSD